MTRGGAVRAAVARISEAGLPSPELDARVLACEAFGTSAAALVADGGAAASQADIDRLDALVVRRLAGEPVARILGRREFWGLDFALAPATLVPRPDSETIVEAALAAIAGLDGRLSVLDLGVGSGCLLLALLSELKGAFGVGVDRSPEAAAAARANAAALGLGGRAAFVVGDWGASLERRFDIIVSNPPYIARGDLAGLDREVRDFDPAAALDGGPDGLDAYRAILADLPRLMTVAGVAVLELGVGQAEPVAGLARAAGLAPRSAVRDLGGVARALVVARRGTPGG